MGDVFVIKGMRGRRIAGAILAVLFATALGIGVGGAQQVQPCDLGSQGDYSGTYATVTTPGQYTIGPQEIVELASEVDGASIQLGLIRPEVPAGVTVPVIVHASVYFHALQGLDLRACDSFLTENYIPHGYAVAFVPVRGTGDSGGCMDLMGPKERADLDQAITWLGEQPWSNGSVGMIGLSYDGSTPWMVASFGNPYLKTIVPVEGVPDLFELMYGRGHVDFRGPAVLHGVYYLQSVAFFAPGRSLEHTIDVTRCPEYLEGIAASVYSAQTLDLDPFGHFAERRYRDDIVRNYRGSVYLVQGLQDWNVDPGLQYPWIWELEEQGVTVHHLLGQWGHSWPYDDESRMDWADVLKGWFDRWLKGDATAPLPARYEIRDSDGLWRRADTWPAGSERTFWLSPGRALAEASSAGSTSELVGPDPFHTQGAYEQFDLPGPLATACLPGCTSFETAPFPDEFRFGGVPELDLTVVPMGPGGQLSAYLYAVSDSGVERLGWGQIDLRLRDGNEPSAVTPGEPTRVRMPIQPLDAVVPAGARLVLIVSEGTAWNRLPTVPNFPMMLLEGAEASALRLVQVTPAPEDFFEPPQPPEP